MVLVVPSGECHDEASVGNALHERENPLREETSGGPPAIAPAWRRKRCFPPLDLAVSRCSRMRRPTGIPVRRDVSLSQSRISSVRRTVSVCLLRYDCNTPPVTHHPPLSPTQLH